MVETANELSMIFKSQSIRDALQCTGNQLFHENAEEEEKTRITLIATPGNGERFCTHHCGRQQLKSIDRSKCVPNAFAHMRTPNKHVNSVAYDTSIINTQSPIRRLTGARLILMYIRSYYVYL